MEATGNDGDRGSATSERVHSALVNGADVRPGDEGWGAAVSESARSGGHGQRVSEAASEGRSGGDGARPDHAGRPEGAGPPAHAGPGAGPPAHAGRPEGAGPPAHAGGPGGRGGNDDAGAPEG